MIRRVQLNINYANNVKLTTLDSFFVEAANVINLYIDKLWVNQDFSSKFVTEKVETWLSARMQQCLGKQALEIVKSQRKKKKRSKPVFQRKTFNLDSRFVKITQDVNSFDIWITLTSIGNKIKLILPSKKHQHFHKFDKWELQKSIRVRKNNDGKYFVDVYFKKEEKVKETEGDVIGLDIGYKKLITCSDGKFYGENVDEIYNKISRKKQGSKAFKRALTERDNKTNKIVNQIQIETRNIKEIVVEDLKNLKRGTKGHLRKSFVNKLQRWSYVNVLRKLSCMAEELGFVLTKINPAYTSQKCSKCGVICKTNRQGESYKCACGLEMDADLNAAINILHLGIYSSQALCMKLHK
jgi:IS605 OrfB family transposase